jgi:FAD-linked oxidoreductase
MASQPTWSNWSASVRCTPQQIATPTSEAEVIALVQAAGREGATVRVAGSGHSFTPLCATADLLISLDGLQGVVAVNAARNEATIWAGTKLFLLGDLLWEHGLALANMGDIDRQSLAGAISTGTHGTGRTLGNLATQVVGLRLVTATGEVVDCSPTHQPAIFYAATVSLGALGVITRVTLGLLPAYALHEQSWVAPFDQCLAQLEEQIQHNRHFEFFWVPGVDACAMKALNPVAANSDLSLLKPPPLKNQTAGQVSGRLARYVREPRVDRSYRIFPSERTLKFNESEFALPAASGPACLCEIRELMQRHYPEVAWPLEYRTVAADKLWLSPASGRETVTISIHQAAELPYEPFFRTVETIFRNHGGRPHWGKLHQHTAPDLYRLYDHWEAFQQVRRALDPAGVFLNDHLRTLFGS